MGKYARKTMDEQKDYNRRQRKNNILLCWRVLMNQTDSGSVSNVIVTNWMTETWCFTFGNDWISPIWTVNAGNL